MGKSYFDEADEERGSLPALTGALLGITGIERSKTGEKAKNPGLRMYVVDLKVKEPKKYTNAGVRDWIVVGTADDPFAKKPETWKRSEGGPGRLKRLLTRSGTALTDDDEEWMEAAVGNEVVAPISARESDDGSGKIFNRPGLYYRPSDEDCPEIGEADASTKKDKGKTAKTKPAAEAEEVETKEDSDEDEKPKKATKSEKKKPAQDPDEEED